MENKRKKEEFSLQGATNSSVLHDKVRHLSRQTPVSGAANTSVCPPPPQSVRTCRRCLRVLPLSDFYTSGGHYAPDCYCKECRREASRLRRKGGTCTARTGRIATGHPVITEVNDPELRMKLIINALHTVRQSIARKLKRLREEEFLQEERKHINKH